MCYADLLKYFFEKNAKRHTEVDSCITGFVEKLYLNG